MKLIYDRNSPISTIRTLLFVAILFGLIYAIIAARPQAKKLLHCRHSILNIISAIHKYADAYGCLPEIEARSGRPFGWRGEINGFFYIRTVSTIDEILSMDAGAFNPSMSMNLKGLSTTIYAVTGDSTAFGPTNRCLPQMRTLKRVLLVSGSPSKQPWYDAENVSLDGLRQKTPLRDVIGEMLTGITFVCFANGEVWEIDSSAPSDLIARCADLTSEVESAAALQELET